MNTRIRGRWSLAIALLAFFPVAASCGKSEARGESRPASLWSELWAFGKDRETLPAETPIKIRLEQHLSTEANHIGDRFDATLAAPLSVRGRILALAGAPVWGELIDLNEGGEVKGKARLTMTLRGLEVAGERHSLETSPLTILAKNSLAAAGADANYILTTKGEQVTFEPGARFRFMLREPLELPVKGES